MTIRADVKAARAIAKKAAAGVKDPELREIARQTIYEHAFSHPTPKKRCKQTRKN